MLRGKNHINMVIILSLAMFREVHPTQARSTVRSYGRTAGRGYQWYKQPHNNSERPVEVLAKHQATEGSQSSRKGTPCQEQRCSKSKLGLGIQPYRPMPQPLTVIRQLHPIMEKPTIKLLNWIESVETKPNVHFVLLKHNSDFVFAPYLWFLLSEWVLPKVLLYLINQPTCSWSINNNTWLCSSSLSELQLSHCKAIPRLHPVLWRTRSSAGPLAISEAIRHVSQLG